MFIRFTFYDGPPFATGLPHYGHILAGTIKDIVTRYAHQSGFHVDRRFGWDCHGLPVVCWSRQPYVLIIFFVRFYLFNHKKRGRRRGKKTSAYEININ